MASATITELEDSKPRASMPTTHHRWISVDRAGWEVRANGSKLTPPSSRIILNLLHLLSERAGQLCSIKELKEAGWRDYGEDPEQVTPDAVYTYIFRTRTYLLDQGINPEVIQNLRGAGYWLMAVPIK